MYVWDNEDAWTSKDKLKDLKCEDHQDKPKGTLHEDLYQQFRKFTIHKSRHHQKVENVESYFDVTITSKFSK